MLYKRSLRKAKTVLGMQVEKKKGKLYVHQKWYIRKLFKLYEMEKCNAM